MRRETMRAETYLTPGQVRRLGQGRRVVASVGEEHDGHRVEVRLIPEPRGSVRVVVRSIEWDHGGDLTQVEKMQ